MPAVNAKGKYQPWYHESFISDPRVRRMSSLARKTYQTLLHEAFVCSARPYLPDDDLELELLADCADTEEWLSVREVVLGMFQRGTCEDQPVLINKRLVEDWNNLLDIREKRSEAGRASGEARRAKSNKAEHVLNIPEHRSFVPNKEVSKLSKEREVSEETEETDMKAEKEIQLACQEAFGVSPRLWNTDKEEIKRLERIHKGSSVLRAFEEWAEQNQEDPSDNPVHKFLQEADSLLRGETNVQKVATSPEILTLTASLTRLSDRKVVFSDQSRMRLATVLQTYTAEEITESFKSFMETQDFSISRVQQYSAKNFAEAANDLAYNVRQDRIDKAKADSQRELAKARLQAEADAERQANEAEKISEAELFDPLSVV